MAICRPVGPMPFTDASLRLVYQDEDGRQYVIADDGTRVYGQWTPPPDDPAVAEDAGAAAVR